MKTYNELFDPTSLKSEEINENQDITMNWVKFIVCIIFILILMNFKGIPGKWLNMDFLYYAGRTTTQTFIQFIVLFYLVLFMEKKTFIYLCTIFIIWEIYYTKFPDFLPGTYKGNYLSYSKYGENKTLLSKGVQKFKKHKVQLEKANKSDIAAEGEIVEKR